MCNIVCFENIHKKFSGNDTDVCTIRNYTIPNAKASASEHYDNGLTNVKGNTLYYYD